ncbi:YkyA family protein [Sporosarcina gallistercoris]|uniref:YkyA family protein n=1 Tax=Sporosarcina gallistercoris TaxID=2762245 RepID=A0ABR8PGG9_9BACL|nr:YkyA family protein [Sporosarcina gallistercoris]MBD7907267.1 YkyA family protein [Sporosarcina gallistercoris]
MQKLFLIIPMCLLLVVSGCTEEKDQMQRELGSILTDIQAYEKKVAEYENQLASLEKKEQILFEKTVDFSVEERELVEGGVSRLDNYLDERWQLIKREQEVIDDAEETIEQLTALSDEASDEGSPSVAELKTALTKRYALHREVIGLYEELMDMQSALYGLLIEENVKRVELEEATIAVNQQRSKLEDAIQVFNQSTLEVNSALKETQRVESE